MQCSTHVDNATKSRVRKSGDVHNAHSAVVVRPRDTSSPLCNSYFPARIDS